MNKFDERYQIRLASYNDIEMIMSFIDTYWRKNHILARNRELFEYEFREGEKVNMVLAIDRGTGLLEGVLGFLYASHSSDKRDIWGSIWKVNEQHGNMPFLGAELVKRMHELTGCRMHLGSGINPKTTLPLMKTLFKYKVEKMKQYYCLNPRVENYHVCKISQPLYLPFKPQEKILEIVELTTMEELKKAFDIEQEDAYPFKDNWYIEKRYYHHPCYKYQIFGLKEEQGITAIVVCRMIEVFGVKVLRIIDYIGKHQSFAETGEFWKRQMEECKYEYIDFYEFGMDDAILNAAGFVCRGENDVNIIPNYFEPFVQENVDIWMHYEQDGTTFFKGDADQDRPNMYIEN